jgi:acyl dehydratase
LKPGDAIPELTLTPDAETPQRYAAASGDANPIHLDDDFARAAGLPGVILHGLYTMAQVARATTAVAGGDPRRLRRLTVQFRAPGLPGQELTVSGRVTEQSASSTLVEASARQDGRRLIRRAEAELAS